MAELRLLRGEIALVDDEDLPKVVGFTWTMSKGYAKTCVKIDGRWVTLRLHRVVMGVPAGVEVDHRDGSRLLDCRKGNLRVANRTGQMANQRVRTSAAKASKFKGVYRKSVTRWGAQLQTIAGKRHLGYFVDETLAAEAYNSAAAEHFGEFALLNTF